MKTYLCSLSSGVGSSTVVAFSAFLNGRYPPADLTGDITVSYSSPTGKQFSLCAYLVPIKTFIFYICHMYNEFLFNTE